MITLFFLHKLRSKNQDGVYMLLNVYLFMIYGLYITIILLYFILYIIILFRAKKKFCQFDIIHF